MTLTLAPRTQKALAVAAGAASWTRLAATTFRIPSQSDPTQTYLVTPVGCSCKDSERHPERPCKHSLGVIIYVTLSETTS